MNFPKNSILMQVNGACKTSYLINSDKPAFLKRSRFYKRKGIQIFINLAVNLIFNINQNLTKNIREYY